MNANDISRSHCCQKRVIKAIFSFISAVLIPISLGVFTVILTLQQESIAKTNREVDLHIASEQHRQNLALALDEQRHTQLITYMREVSDLLLANNFSLNRLILTSIVQPKTLAILRQLDVTRKSYLLRFLHESQLLSVSNPTYLSLSSADFNHIHLGVFGESIDMRYISFYGTYFNNVTFISVSFGYSVFRYARLRGTSFQIIGFDYASLRSADLRNTTFETCSLYGADLTRANMRGAEINQRLIDSAGSISQTILPNGTIGRNRNLLNNSICEKINDKNNIQQNCSVNQYRLWMKEIGQIRKLEYLITGWFNNTDNLLAYFTEFNENGIEVQKYCLTNKNNLTQSCIVHEWLFTNTSVLNDENQFKYVRNGLNAHDETYIVNIDIHLGQHGICQDVHFSIETT